MEGKGGRKNGAQGTDLMGVFLNTSVIIRYLANDHPEMSNQATQIIEEVDDLTVTEGILGETAFVLTSVYGKSRSEVVDSLIDSVERENISTYAKDKDLLVQGLMMCRPSVRVSIADAMLWAAARTDRRFPSQGIEIRQTL